MAIKETGPAGRKTRKEVWFKDGLVEKPDHETRLTLKTRLKQERTDYGLVARNLHHHQLFQCLNWHCESENFPDANLTDRDRFHGQKDDCISMMMMMMMIK